MTKKVKTPRKGSKVYKSEAVDVANKVEYVLDDKANVVVLSGISAADNGNAADDEAADLASKSVIPPKKKKAYGPTQSCQDNISKLMKTATAAGITLEDIANFNQLDIGRWSHLNAGMQRMNLGNAIRGLIKRGELDRLHLN